MIYITAKDFKTLYAKQLAEANRIKASFDGIEKELSNQTAILDSNTQLGYDFLSFRRAKDNSKLLLMTSLINTIDTFLDIQVFIPSKRILPVFRLLGRCVEEKGLPIVSIEHMQMEKEFRNNGIGTIALTYLIDWAEREKKTL